MPSLQKHYELKADHFIGKKAEEINPLMLSAFISKGIGKIKNGRFYKLNNKEKANHSINVAKVHLKDIAREKRDIKFLMDNSKSKSDIKDYREKMKELNFAVSVNKKIIKRNTKIIKCQE